ncbi:MAG: nuclear transport factor 2 family protein [Polyangiales bacterium]
MADEDDVLKANARFYDAFVRRDADAMDALWARTLPVACIHPGWSALRGRARVLASWRGILGNPGSPKLRCVGASVHLLGEVAFVICYEEVEGGRLLATNVYAREDGEWKMVHHQAGPTSRRDEDEEPESERPDLKKLN